MIRLVFVLSLLLSTVAWAMPTAAQDATATATLGDPAKVYGPNGEPVGEVAVTDITDPFTDFDTINSQPPRGYHWAMVTVSLTAGAQPLPINYSGFTMVDSSGYYYYQSYVTRTAESTAANPDLSASQVEAGQTLTGVVFFQVFGDSEIAMIEYAPSYEQAVVVADLREEKVAAGDTVTWLSGEDEPLGELSVVGVVDPLQDFDASYPPQRGFRYVGIAITFTNLSDRPATIDQYRFSIIDHQGFVSSAYGVYRTAEGVASLPDLSYVEVAPGASITGLTSFQMINGATVKDVIFSPQSDRRIRLAEYEADATYDPPAITPVPTVAPDPACEAVLVWGQGAVAALAQLGATFELVDQVSQGEEVDPASLRTTADTFDAAADNLESIETPEAAQAAAEQFIETLRKVADQIRTLADDVEAKNDANIQADVAAIYENVFGLTGGAFAALAERCPGLNDL